MTDPVLAPVPDAEVPQVREIPAAPRRSDAIDPDVWTAMAEARLAAEPLRDADMNAVVLFANRCAEVANNEAQAAVQAADAAASSAAMSASSAQAAGESEAAAASSASAAASGASSAAASASSSAGSAQAASASAQSAAADAQAVADGLASIAGGPVASVAGKTGVVTLEQLAEAGVATQSGAETLTNKTLSGPRSSMAQYIDKTVTNAAATGTATLDLSQADVFDLTLAGATTLAISNAPALSGETFAIVVRVSQGATAFALTWFSGITWLTSGGTAPAAPAANKSVEYVLSTTDGTNWIGRKGAAN